MVAALVTLARSAPGNGGGRMWIEPKFGSVPKWRGRLAHALQRIVGEAPTPLWILAEQKSRNEANFPRNSRLRPTLACFWQNHREARLKMSHFVSLLQCENVANHHRRIEKPNPPAPASLGRAGSCSFGGENDYNTAMSPPVSRKFTLSDLRAARESGRKIPMLTCYDFTTARLMQEAGVPTLLAGDSAANVILGHQTTLPVSLDFMI